MLTFRFLAGVSAAFVSPQVWASIPLLIEKKQIVKAIGVATAGLSISNFRAATGSLFSNDTLYNPILFHWYIISTTCHSYLCCITRNTVGSYRWK